MRRDVPSSIEAACVALCAFGLLALAEIARAEERPEQNEAPGGSAQVSRGADSARVKKIEGSGVGKKSKEPPEPLRDAPIEPDQKRQLPDYAGRGGEPTTAGDVLIWVPRILLSPLYLVSEFVVRRPLGFVVTAAEREKLPSLLIDWFTWGPEQNAGIIPTAMIDFGLRPSVGLYHFWNDFIAKGNKLRARAAWGGDNWLMLTVADRVEVGPDQELGVRGEYLRRPDNVFHGFGPESPSYGFASGPRFLAEHIDGGLVYEALLWRSSRFVATVGIRDVFLDPAIGAYTDPTLAQEIAARNIAEPPGLASAGYTVIRQSVDAALDSRPRRHLQSPKQGSDYVSPPGSGIKLDLRGEHATGLGKDRPLPGEPAERWHWVKYGGTLGGFIDVTGEQRIIGLSLVADFVDPLPPSDQGCPTQEFGKSTSVSAPSGCIPFTEQVALGGFGPLQGFLPGRLVDRSGVAAILEYQFPVWVWLDGAISYTVGNVFGKHLSGFDLELLRSSIGLSMRSNGSRDHPFQLTIAMGTKTFRDGGGFENLRFVIGATSGF